MVDFFPRYGIRDHFDSIDLQFYDQLLTFLYSPPHNFSLNNTGKIIQNLKAVLNNAVSEGITTNLKFRIKRFKKPSQKTTHIYLTMEELHKIANVRCETKTLEKVRDVLLILCYTGLRYSDVFKVTSDAVRTVIRDGRKIEIIEILTKKTGKMVSIPMHPVVRELLDKYQFTIPKFSNQKLNQYLKSVAKSAGLLDTVSITTSVAGKPVVVTKPKYQFVCSHIGRRTLITNMYLSQIDPHSIRLVSGHSSASEFERYIKVTLEQNSISLSGHAFFSKINDPL